MLIVPFLLFAFLPFFIDVKFKYYDILIIVFSTLLLWQSKDLPDFANMEFVYNIAKKGDLYSDTGTGWSFLCRLGGLFINDYKYFWILIFLISIFLIRCTINYYINLPENRAIIWGCFLIFPFMLEGIQIRFFLAESTVLFFIRFLFNSSIRKRILFAGAVIIMSLVHSSVLIYLLFWFAVEFKSFRKTIPFISLAIFIFIIFGMNIVISIVSLFVNDNRIGTYFSNQDPAGLLGLVAYFFITFAFIWVAYSIKKQLTNNDISRLLYLFCKKRKALKNHSIQYWLSNDDVKKTNSYANKFSFLTSSSLFFLPLTLIDNNLFRVQRILWVLLFILIAFLMENGYKKIKMCFWNKKYKYVNSKYIIYSLTIAANIALISAFNWHVIECYLFN